MRRWWLALAVSAGCGADVPNTAQCTGTDEVLYSGHVWGANLAVADGAVYFTTFDVGTVDIGDGPHTVMAVSTTCGGPPQTVANISSPRLFGSGMAVRGGRVIWTQETEIASMGVYSAPITGGDPTLVGQVDDVAYYASFAADNDAVYIADGQDIIRIPLDGTGASAIGTPIPSDEQLTWIEMRDTALYYATEGASTFSMYTLDTNNGVVTSFAAPTDYHGGQFDLDDADFYLPTASGIELVDFGGIAHGHVTNGAFQWSTVIRGPDGFYGSDSEGAIARMAFDGSTLDELGTSAAVAQTLVTDGISVYATGCCSAVYELPAAN